MPHPKGYTQGHSDSSQARHSARTFESTCAYFAHLIKSDMAVLDVGCGPGSITAGIARHVPDGSVIGLDAAETTLERARAQVDLPANCTFRTGDAMALDFPENTFDIVHTSQVVGHMRDQPAMLRELRRVLKPGGFLASREGDSDGSIYYPETDGLLLWRRAQREVAVKSGRDPHIGRKLKAFAIEAGFDADKIEYTAGAMTFAGSNAWTTAETMMNQTKDDPVARQSLTEYGGLDEAGMQAIYDGWDEWRRHPACTFALLNGQIVAYK